MRGTVGERGVTLLELLVGAMVAFLLALGGISILRNAGHGAINVSVSTIQTQSAAAVLRVMDEIGSAERVIEVRSDCITVQVNPSASRTAIRYRDPLSGRDVTVDRYFVQYRFRNGALYRLTGVPIGISILPPHSMGCMWMIGGTETAVLRATGSFSYVDDRGNPTKDPGMVRMVYLNYSGTSGSGSTGVMVGGKGFSARLTKQIRTPSPCEANPRVCGDEPGMMVARICYFLAEEPGQHDRCTWISADPNNLLRVGKSVGPFYGYERFFGFNLGESPSFFYILKNLSTFLAGFGGYPYYSNPFKFYPAWGNPSSPSLGPELGVRKYGSGWWQWEWLWPDGRVAVRWTTSALEYSRYNTRRNCPYYGAEQVYCDWFAFYP